MEPRDEAERLARLAEAIDVADSIRPLFNHPEVLRWFDRSERALIETVLAATDETSRVMAVAQVKAIRDLKAYLTSVEAASQSAAKKITALRKYEHPR